MLVFSHDDAARHLTPEGHPERPERLAAAKAGVAGLAVTHREAPLADMADVLRCHEADHVARLMAAVPDRGLVAIDGDTFLSSGSGDAALRAVGGMCAAIDAVIAGEAGSALNLARPPGHHAERDRAMGFCLFGTAAIGAVRALDHHGLGRIAIVDFDVHHGNGTQAILWDEPRCLFVSSHQMPLYPGSGAVAERGAHGQIVNLPLAPGSGSAAMRAAWEGNGLPALAAFAPDLIVISAGFDAHADDPLGGLRWQAADFAWLTRCICNVGAAGPSQGRIVSTLEGGYDLSALTACVAAHAGVLAERG